MGVDVQDDLNQHASGAKVQSLFTSPLAERSTEEGDADYRALSATSIASLLLGLLSISSLLGWSLVSIPALGALLGAYGLFYTVKYPAEYTGRGFALGGLVLSLGFLIGSLGWHSYIYATEVPPGHERISYSLLQPNPQNLNELFPPSVIDLEGAPVFIKGYVYPTEQQHGIRKFMLVRDQGDCCFGGNPKVTERILITLKDPRGFSFSSKQFKVAGKFRFQPIAAPAGMAGGDVFYHIDDAELR